MSKIDTEELKDLKKVLKPLKRRLQKLRKSVF